MMTPAQFLATVESESQKIATLTVGALDCQISFIDDWRVRDLIAHVGAVYSYVIANNRDSSTEHARPGDEASAPDGDAIHEWFSERRQTLLTTLAAADNDMPAASFAGLQTSGWWKRRMAHETSVHRWDADAAINGVTNAAAFESEMAADGIAEFLEVNLSFSSQFPNRAYPTESLHLHRTDGPGEWMLVGNDDGTLTVTHEHGKGDAAVRGTAAALLLWVWGRPTDEVEIFGDQTVATTWQALAP